MLLESGRDMTPNLAEVRLAVLGKQLQAHRACQHINHLPLQHNRRLTVANELSSRSGPGMSVSFHGSTFQ
jgi:hypothetical protein